jgi:hypothetical protein
VNADDASMGGGNEIKRSGADAARERLGGMQPEVRKFCCPGNATTRGQKKGAIALAYPVEYPRRMTDRGMYAKISAYRDVAWSG